ncbi:MAG: 2-amino-4-hydroxy-6-hydroxymethyldihydropteridine diphosphokinase [Verrucomicrobiota bacterium]
MARVGIALGSNLGDRLANLRAARTLLLRLAPPGAAFLQAPVYQTAPGHCPADSPDFYNTVVEIEFDGTPCELLAQTRQIEATLGRTAAAVRNAPRVIDVDLLYVGAEMVASKVLELPHPRLALRRFVLQPLADIRPELRLPGEATSIAEHLRQLGDDEPALALVRVDW